MDETVRSIVQRVRATLVARYGDRVRAVLLYGSCARGTATADSDVDLLVVVSDELSPWRVRRELDDLLFSSLLETGRLVSVLVVPESAYRAGDSPFLRAVRREGVPI